MLQKSLNVLPVNVLGLVLFTDIYCHKISTSLILWSSLLLVPFPTSSANKFQGTWTRQYITVKAESEQWVNHTTYNMVLSVSNVSNCQIMLCIMFCQIIFNNTHVPTTSSNIIRTRIVPIQLRKQVIAVEEWKTNLMSLAILFHFLCAQHVSEINISIIRSLRLLPHRSSCSQFIVCWSFVAAGFRWCSFCRLKPANSSTQSQAPDDGYINVRNMLST